jgi:hypothetical protein
MAKRKVGTNSGIGTDIPPLAAPPTTLPLDEAQDTVEPKPTQGNIPPTTTAADPAASRARARDVSARFVKEGRWAGDGGLQYVRDQMIKEAKAAGMDIDAARSWTYAELDRLYPPLGQPQPESETPTPPRVAQDGRVQGLGDIPADWPDLPANASLAADVSWVQSERLYIVEELASGAVRVHLDKSHEPPPSRAALGWLETSIRAYAKFIDVAARATSTQQDEAESVRRERLAIDEIRDLLRSMLPVCPHCGASLM